MRARAVALLAFAAALVAGACNGGEQAPPDDADDGFHAEPAPEAKDFKLVVTAEPNVPLGGDLVLRVRVENHGDVKAKVNVPRLGRDSVVFKVRSESFDVAWLDPQPVKETENGAQPSPPETREIGKGESVEGEIRVVAALRGKLDLTPVYRCQDLPELLTAPTVTVQVAPPAEGKDLGVRLETSHGTIDAKLRPDLAFQTCTMFATLVKKGFYDGLTFHRVIQGFMAQGGDPQGAGWGGPGYMLRRELHGKLPHRRGVFSMARQNRPVDSAGSQFFVMLKDASHLDAGGYTTFAEMVAGESALQRIEAAGAGPASQTEAPREKITITKATLLFLP